MKRVAIVILFALWSFPGWSGGGWSEKKGNGFFKLGQYVIIANDFYNPEGEIIPITTVSYYATSLYAEYGLSDRITAVGYVPFFVRTTLNRIEFRQSGTVIPGDEESNVGDPIIGIKYGFLQDKPIVLATSILLGLPLGEPRGGEGQILQTGDGEFNQILKVEASRSFYPKPVYATVMTGFNHRTKGFSEEFLFGLEVGYTLKDRLLLALKLDGVESFKNGTPTGSAGNGIFSNNTEYIAITPEVSYFFSGKFGVTAGMGFAARGERILASPAFQFGIFMLRK